MDCQGADECVGSVDLPDGMQSVKTLKKLQKFSQNKKILLILAEFLE